MEENILMHESISLLMYCGYWYIPQKNKPIFNILLKIYCRTMLTVFIVFGICDYIEMFIVWRDMFSLMMNLSISLLYVILFVKTKMILFDKDKVWNLIYRMYDFQQQVLNGYNEQNKVIFMDYARSLAVFTRCFAALVAFTKLMLILPGFMCILGYNKDVYAQGMVMKPLPYHSYLPFDKQKHYEWAYVLTSILGTPGGFYVFSWDLVIISLLVCVICQLKILQNSLISLGDADVKSVYEETVACVQLHQSIIKYVEDLDALLSNIMFFDFLVAAAFLCSIGFRLIFDTNLGIPELMSCVVYLGAALVQLFLFYWTGNLLMLESVEVCNAVWSSKWYNFDKRVKQLLVLLMMRAQKPLKITVGVFYDMNLESLIIILRAWYSFLTVLMQMQE